MLQDSRKNTLPLVPKGIAAWDAQQAPVLVGGHCSQCRRDFFPRPSRCPQCLGAVDERALSGEGAIYSYTVVRARPPLGLPQPYAVGYIDLSQSGLRIFGLLDPDDIDRLAIGAAVNLKVAPLGKSNQGEPCLRPYFSLAAVENDHG